MEAVKAIFRGKETTLREVAEMLGLGIEIVRGYWKHHKSLEGIENRKPCPQSKLRKRVDYHGEMLTFQEIADITGDTEQVVHSYFKKHHGTMEGFDDRHKDLFKRRTQHFIKRFEFHGEQLTRVEIAARTGTSAEQVRGFQRNHGTLDGYESRREHWYDKRYKIKAMFHGEEKTLEEIAEETGLTRNGIYSYWKKYKTFDDWDKRWERAKKAWKEANSRRFEWDGKETTYFELAEMFNIPKDTMSRRIRNRGTPYVGRNSIYTQRDVKAKAVLGG